VEKWNVGRAGPQARLPGVGIRPVEDVGSHQADRPRVD